MRQLTNVPVYRNKSRRTSRNEKEKKAIKVWTTIGALQFNFQQLLFLNLHRNYIHKKVIIDHNMKQCMTNVNVTVSVNIL